MFDAAVAGDLKAMYIFGEDVAQTDPNTAHVIRALESLEFMVCQDIFETETSKYADVVLPASSFLEKSGTFVNAERRVQLVAAAIEPPGEARTDFDIITAVSRALGHDMGLETPRTRRARSPRSRRTSPAPRPSCSAGRASSGRSRPTAPTRRSSTASTSSCPAGARSSPRCPTRSPVTLPTTSSR